MDQHVDEPDQRPHSDVLPDLGRGIPLQVSNLRIPAAAGRRPKNNTSPGRHMNKPVMLAVRRRADDRFRWSAAAGAAGIRAARLIAVTVFAATAVGMLMGAELS